MSEMSRRRRWTGRVLLGAGALALPLTASISYASATAQPAPPAPASPHVPPTARAMDIPHPPTAPSAPDARHLEAEVDEVRHLAIVPDAAIAPPMPPLPPMPPMPPVPPMPHADVDGLSPHDPQFGVRMEEFGRAMEEWGEAFGKRYAAQAEAWAEAAARNAPEVVESCDDNERTRTVEGRPRIVICQRDIELAARSGLRMARASIAQNGHMDTELRSEILKDLDRQLAEMDRRSN